MLKKFHCWFDYLNAAEGEGRSVEAIDAMSAAEAYAEHCWETDDGEELEIHVRDEQGVVKRFEVYVDFNPSFSAYPLPESAEKGGG